MAVRDFHVLLAVLLYSTTACSGELQPERDDAFLGAGAGSAASGTGGSVASGVAGAAGQAPSHAGRGGNGSIEDAGAPSSTDGATTLADAGNTDANLVDAGADAAQAVPEGPIGPSEGCGHAPDDAAALQGFSKHDISVSGVDPDFISEHVPKSEIAPYTWTHRNYFLKLPANYDPQKPYALHFGGSGCGNTDGMSGQGGGLTVLPNDQDSAIQVGLSYVYDGGACFADGFANTPDLPYFDAVLAEVEAQYCVERSKVFVAGFSSGAWESYMLGCARGGVVRAIATAAGGLRRERPACSSIPAAALLLTGAQDDANPIVNIDQDGFDSGAGAARDAVLTLNGCIGTETEDWPLYPTCKRYTGCPAAYPVIWCTPPGGHMDGGGEYKTAIAQFWSSLPER